MHTMKNRTTVIFLIISIFITCGVSTTQAFSMSDSVKKKTEETEIKEYQVYGEKTTVSTKNRWLSDDPEDLTWIVEIPGVPTDIYVIDQEAQEEISHMETVNHPAVTHQEAIYSTRTKWTVSYYGPENDYTEQLIGVHYDMTEDQILQYYAERDCDTTGMSSEQEQYISGYRTVTDQAAWSEEVKVIDQEQLEEIGHYETIIVGEVGYYVNNREIPPTQGEGHFEAMVRKNRTEYVKVEE